MRAVAGVAASSIEATAGCCPVTARSSGSLPVCVDGRGRSRKGGPRSVSNATRGADGREANQAAATLPLASTQLKGWLLELAPNPYPFTSPDPCRPPSTPAAAL
jgi:hypothetical protein